MIDFCASPDAPEDIHEIQRHPCLDVILVFLSKIKPTSFVLSYFIDGFARMGLMAITDYLSTYPI